MKSAVVEHEVRDLIRIRGVDPHREAGAIAALINEVLTDYDERAIRGLVPAFQDRDVVYAEVLANVAGFGELQIFLDDPEVEEIWINSPGEVYVARAGRPFLTNVILDPSDVPVMIERMLSFSGRRFDISVPFVDATLPDKSRLHIVGPPITQQYAVNIRKFIATSHQLSDLVAREMLTEHAAKFLEAAMISGCNVVVSGATGAGKTTFLNALSGSIPEGERVISVEEVFELNLSVRDWVPMQCRQSNLEGHGEVPLRALIKEALRMRPTRLVVGEVRQAEALDMLLAFNSGLPGMCTVHANSAHEAALKLTTLPLLAGENVTAAFVLPTVARCVDILVHVNKLPSGVRQVSEIIALSGRIEGSVMETNVLFERNGHELERATGFPSQLSKFEQAGIDICAILRDGS